MEEVKTSDNWVILLGNGRGFRKRDFFFGFWNTPATPLQHFPAAHSLLTHAWTLVGVVGVPPHPPHLPLQAAQRRLDHGDEEELVDTMAKEGMDRNKPNVE